MKIGIPYDDYFMSDITNIFKAKNQHEYDYQFDILYHSFFNEEKSKNADMRTWSRFKHICQKLTELEAYSVIIYFMYGVFLHHEEYDLKHFYEVLSDIKVSPNIKLSDLCSEFFVYSKLIERNYDITEDEKKNILNISIEKAEQLYFENISEHYKVRTYAPNTIVNILPEFICFRVYDYSINMKVFGKEDLEYLIESVLTKRQRKIEEIAKRIDEQNALIEKENREMGGKVFLGKFVKEKITYYDTHCVVPGLILPIFKALEVEGKKEFCYEILNDYVLKIFAETPWEYKTKPELQVMVALFASYCDFIFSLENYDVKMNYTNPVPIYNSEQFMCEIIGKNDGYFISKGKQLFKDYSKIGVEFASIIKRGKEYMKPILRREIYSFLIAHTAYILYCSGQNKMAVNHLLMHYDDIDVSDKRKLYFQVTLGRCILSCEQLEPANSLYGYFNYEMDRHERGKMDIFYHINSMLCFLEDAKEYIRLKGEYTITTNESWYDILYKDGKIDSVVAQIKEKNDKKILVDESLFNQMINIISAYSYPTGIRLGLLGLPNYDDYDKLENALSATLKMRANGYIDKLEEYRAYFQSKSQLSIRQDVNIIMQHHMSKLVKNTIEDSIQKISLLKKKYYDETVKNSDESVENNSDEFEKLLDDICNELSAKLQYNNSGRTEIENYILDIQKEFIERYCHDYDGFDLIQKLPLELRTNVLNYLVTSETVFRILSSRKDADELDFSAALISLTKVVEVILNYIFSKMDVIYDSKMDPTFVKNFFYNGQPKGSIEFGPGIFLLKDSKKIIVESEKDNKLKNTGKFEVKHFSLWKGNDVIDISKLKKYQDIDMKVSGYNNKTSVMHFTNDDIHNRMLLAKALEYIKDNYRNTMAHKDMIKLTKLKEGRELLILTENMIWILLDILKPEK